MKFDSENDRITAMTVAVREGIAASVRAARAKSRVDAAWAAADAAEALQNGREIAEGATVSFVDPLEILQKAAVRSAEISVNKGNAVN